MGPFSGALPLGRSRDIIYLSPQFIANLHSPRFSQGYNIMDPYIYLSAFCPETTLKTLERYNASENKT